MVQNATPPRPLLPEASLRELIAAGGVTKVEAVGRSGGFELQVHMGVAVATLGNSRGGTRLFASVGPLIGLLKTVGCTRFEVDSTAYVVGPLRPTAIPAPPAAKAKPKPPKLTKAISKTARVRKP